MRRARWEWIKVCLAVALSGGIGAEAGAAPQTLPDAVVRAHSIFLVNETGFVELQYAAVLELEKWGRFDFAESREKADLVLRLDNGNQVRPLPEGTDPAPHMIPASSDTNVLKGHTRIALFDPKTNTLLWSGLHKTEGGKVKSGHLLDGLREAFDRYERGKR